MFNGVAGIVDIIVLRKVIKRTKNNNKLDVYEVIGVRQQSQ
jgi:hypothetical protein